MPPTSTRKDYRQYVIKRFYKPRHPIVSVTTSDGTTTTLIDEILSPAAQDTNFLKAWIYIVETVASGATIFSVGRVTNVDFSGSTSTLTFAPAMNAAPKDTTDYELHYKYHPDYLEDLIEEVMSNLEISLLIPLTSVADGDMEAGNTTSWTAATVAGANPTLTKDTTTVLHGRQALKILANAESISSYAKSTSVYFPSNTQLLCAADVYITSGDSAKLSLIDITNSDAELETAESDATGWVHLEFTYTTPSTCEEVQLWLESPAASDATYWDNITLLPIQQNLFTPPDEVEYAHDFGKLYYYPKGADVPGSGNDYATKIFEGKPEHFCHYNIERDDTAVVPMRVVLDKTPITHPLWLECDVDFAALTDDTTTSTAPKELVGQLVLGELYDDWADEEEEMGHDEAADKLRANAVRARLKVAGDFHNFRQLRTVTKGAL